MNEFRPGLIERWSGKALRWLMGWLFAVGAALLLWGANQWAQQPVADVELMWGAGYVLALMAPYLVIRYRDPESTTIPFASRFGRAS